MNPEPKNTKNGAWMPTLVFDKSLKINRKTLLEAFLGNLPHANTIEKVFYEHKADGFYNFYVENYRNMFFLPDWLSQWMQLNLDMSVDITVLELAREAVFLGLLFFLAVLHLRIQLYWFLTINPYTRPWVYFISLTDWIFDVVAGFSPVVLGLDLSSAIISGFVGKVADNLNHLVFAFTFSTVSNPDVISLNCCL